MTRKQIKTAKEALPSYKDRNAEEQQLYTELSCREMINSCFAYGQAYNFYTPSTDTFGCFATDYIETLGEATVKRLFSEQSADFAKAYVKHDVYQDSEGCSYNSIVWEDEQ